MIGCEQKENQEGSLLFTYYFIMQMMLFFFLPVAVVFHTSVTAGIQL